MISELREVTRSSDGLGNGLITNWVDLNRRLAVESTWSSNSGKPEQCHVFTSMFMSFVGTHFCHGVFNLTKRAICVEGLRYDGRFQNQN